MNIFPVLLSNSNARLLGAPAGSKVIILRKVDIIEISPVGRKVNIEGIVVMVVEEKKSIVLLFALISLRKCVCKCVDFYVWTSYECYVLDKHVNKKSSHHYVLTLGRK